VPSEPPADKTNVDALVAGDIATTVEGESDVVDAVLAASRVFVAVASKAVANAEPQVTLPQFRTLVLLDARGRLSVAELADALGVVPSTASRMCDRLVTKGLIRRAASRSNRRQVMLNLSERGRALLAESTRQRKREIAELLSTISPTDQKRLARALRRLVEAGLQ